jgi:pyruvate ferredoxin oxidoreductase delta subunit
MSGPKKWNELTPGAVVLEAGNAVKFKTGSWRSFRPRWLEENCIQCLMCWLYCPDMAVKVKDGKVTGFDYDYCKGCGVCAKECPGKKGAKAIVMEPEGK